MTSDDYRSEKLFAAVEEVFGNWKNEKELLAGAVNREQEAARLLRKALQRTNLLWDMSVHEFFFRHPFVIPSMCKHAVARFYELDHSAIYEMCAKEFEHVQGS